MAVDVIGVPIEVIRSRTVFYRPAVIDIKCCHTIHGCSNCPNIGNSSCSAIHFGVCVPVKSKADIFNAFSADAQTCSFPYAYKKNEISNKSRESPQPILNFSPAPSNFEPKIIEKPSQPVKERFEIKKELPEEKPNAIESERHLEGNVVPSKLADVPANASAQHIKPFYFPMGVPSPSVDKTSSEIARLVQDEFDKAEGKKISVKEMGSIVKVCRMPYYWKVPFFRYLCTGEAQEYITFQKFLAGWNRLTKTCFDDASKFIQICSKPGHNYMVFEDFLPLIQDVVDCHPGLTFLQDAPEFHSRYIQTVISRIFYCLNRSWSGKITVQELRNSNLLKTIERLEVEEDINQILDYFSYEHFYVIYCKFWELDQDHDLLISESDLARHNNYAISSRMIGRIFSGAVTRNLTNGKLTYRDFVWFLISEEDKRHPRSVEYWFRCMDVDGDGIISMYEMEYFYEEQIKKMEMLDIETLPFQDCLCQMLDMINPSEPGRIRLKDLKASSLAPIFFDTFFNLEKYLRHEQKDPFSNLRDGEDAGLSDFDRFAAEEYEMLVAEEGSGDNQHPEIIYDDDFEQEDSRHGEDHSRRND